MLSIIYKGDIMANSRVKNEKKVVSIMVKIYCRQHKKEKVMIYSGPRMLFYSPITAIKHFFQK